MKAISKTVEVDFTVEDIEQVLPELDVIGKARLLLKLLNVTPTSDIDKIIECLPMIENIQKLKHVTQLWHSKEIVDNVVDNDVSIDTNSTKYLRIREGYKAFQGGLDLDENPYEPGCNSYYWWIEGWQKAKKLTEI
jgi:hypothetical protein